MTVPYTFAAQVGNLPLSQLDSNFATTTTLGTTPFQLGDTVPTISGLSFANPTITGNILPTVTNTQTIGSPALLWNNIYSTTFTGSLLGNVTGNVTGNLTGNASTATVANSVVDGVYTVTDQTIGGNKTFSNTIIGSINGNAATVTNGVYTNTAQNITGVKTFTADTILTSTNGGGQLAGLRNRLNNGSYRVNQRGVSGSVVLVAGAYGHDRWKAGASGCTYTFATVDNVTTLTISAGSLQQVIEGLNLETGTYCLSWSGTATGQIGGGTAGASGVTAAITGGVNTTIEILTGTVTNVQLELGTTFTPFEQIPYGLDLQLCQRFYYRITAGVPNGRFGAGHLTTTVGGVYMIPFPVTMRVAPISSGLTLTGTALNYVVLNLNTATATTGGSYVAFAAATTNALVLTSVTTTALVAGQAVELGGAVATAFIGISVDL
jgi:hypothetical protein